MSGSSLQTILLVEDYKDSREMIRFLLESLSYRVLAAGNGQDALNLAAQEEPDLILTDFNLPDLLGTELTRRVRKLSEKLNRIPIIMLTAHDRNEFYELAIAAGCTAFFTKPIDFVVLETTIAKLLEKSREIKGTVNDISQ
jgi:two-component system, cell cycle response regulator DivK